MTELKQNLEIARKYASDQAVVAQERYVDDMAVGSQTWSEHKDHLNKFFTIIKDSGLTVNLRKTEFAKSHIAGSGSKTPDPDRLQAIKEIARPQIKSVLGMLGYHRDYLWVR